MQRQNVTLSLPQNLLRQAKHIATRHHKSLSEFMRESLEQRVEEVSGYKKAMERQIKLMSAGFDLGTCGTIKISRDDLHERG
ncbi:MAG: CopG domain protein DNA-binding domain protein [Deltaproteobacteria bacterium]|jgi:metal-responsive CopG/Arc/MetJ family transcriptional regulator|nr:CopG domain protein DNA-binding domain protein [Deltaproteobacteria bacterium]